MSRNLYRLAALGAVGALALAPAAAAFASPSSHGVSAAAHQTKPRPAKPVRQVQGTITAIDTTAMTITVSRHASHHTTVSATFAVSSSTLFNRDDQPATLADLAIGDHASAKVRAVDGTVTALRVNAESPEPAEDPEPEPSPSDD